MRQHDVEHVDAKTHWTLRPRRHLIDFDREVTHWAEAKVFLSFVPVRPDLHYGLLAASIAV
jgi:hypothetical protein